MAERNPQEERFAPGTDPVPPEDQIPDWPSDSAEWANLPLPQYVNGSPFPELEEDDRVGPDEGEQEATDG